MPLDIDLNHSCNDSNAVDSVTSIMDHPSASSLFPIDLNVCPSYEEEAIATTFDLNVCPPYEDVPENEAAFSNNDIDSKNNDLSLNEDDEANSVDDEANSSDVLPEVVHVAHEAQSSQPKRSFLDNSKRKIISEILMHSCRNGRLQHGIVKRVASSYSVSIDVIYRIWRQINETGDACHKKTKNCGRKRVQIDFEKVRDISLAKRSTLRSFACALGIKSKTSLRNYIKEGVLRRHSSTVNPQLKDDNMKARLKFCLSMLEENSIPHDPTFKSMYNVVHIDEKWFYMSQRSKNYYLHTNEDDPYRTCRNKNYIEKVMFLVAVARPRFDNEGKETFSGKIGVFPLVDKVPARRSSVNRTAGTLETKPITSITKEVSRMFLINKILPAIKEKWPREHVHETIYIQQDNAPCHVSPNDEEFCRAASEGGFDIRMIYQPPNSPDLNVLDLGFFSAIQSLQQKEVTKSVDELVEAVEKAYETFDSKKSNKIFLTLQSCMIEILKVKGSNGYKTPHIKKDALLIRGMLPTQLKCDRELVHEIFEYLHNID